MNDAVLCGYFRYFLFLYPTRGIDQSIIHGALTFSNNSYLQTINRATRQLLTENKSETRRRRFIADDLSLRKIIRHATVQCNEKRPSARHAGPGTACGICGQFLWKYNKLRAVIRSNAHNYISICGLANLLEREARRPAHGGLTAAAT